MLMTTAQAIHRVFANGRSVSRTGGPAPKPAPWVASFVGVTILGAALGFLGPYGSYLNDAVPVRIAYWIGTLWISLPIFGASLWAARALARRAWLPVWLGVMVAVIVASALQTLIVATIANQLWPGVIQLGPIEWYGQVLFISAVVVGVLFLVRRVRLAAPAAAAETPSTSTAADEAPGAPLCLQMEDHYVRMHFAHGSRLVHGTMNDIIAREACTPGLRVHRSWWVARSAVMETVVEGRNYRLKLANGVLVPVSRSKVAVLQAAGWLRLSRHASGQHRASAPKTATAPAAVAGRATRAEAGESPVGKLGKPGP